jgi:catechol 2,3-dioxygenase-like lactoylglutathione lyase family enzyme
MKPHSAATIFHVKDVEASIQYYTDVLGFSLGFRYNDFAGLEYGKVLIYLSGPKQEVKKLAGEGAVYIFCDEVDEYYKHITVKTDSISVTIDDRGYGMRDFAVRDPDGNFITFGVEIETEDPGI